MSARLRGLFGRWFAAALVLCLLGTGAALAAGPLAHVTAKKQRRADLVVPSAAAKLASGQITVTVVASNRGRRSAAASTGAVAWKPAAKGSRATRLKTFAVGALASRARRSVKVTLAVPAGSSGAYAVTVCLDVKAKVRESGGANNCRSAGTVTVPAGAALGEQKTSPAPTTPSSSPATGGSGSPGAGSGSGGGPTDGRGAPDTAITRGPVGVDGTRSATMLFTSPEAGATFQCRLDGADWAVCSSPVVLTSLPDGLHIFEVRAGNAAGSDPTPASRTWTVDATAPETTIASAPAAAVNVTTAHFEFSSSESTGSIECKLDGSGWTFCTSPLDLTGLTAGSHTLLIRATDGALNTDATPATRTWIVDQTPPQTTIGSGPSGVTTGPAATFGFSSEAGATFECRLDSGLWAPCTSPQALTGLATGSHTFDVRAVDAAGNPDTTPESRTWTVDAAAPETTITGGPSGTVNTGAASLTFASSEVGSTFECRIDGGAFAACTSPKAYALADGSHTFEVRATDAVGNVDATVASRTWTVDTTAPETTITGGPSGTVNTGAASLTFSSSEPGSTFQCRIDGGAFTACTSPQAYASLADGAHTFEVRATDAVGNTDQSAATRAWIIDATAPQTTIDTGPSGTAPSTSATFSFSSSEAGSTFQCRLDNAAFAACTSPVMYTSLGQGQHTFEVRATDAAQNQDASPASRTWTVDTAAPDTTITGGPSGTVNTGAASFTFTSTEAGSTFACRIDGGAFTACTSPQAYAGLADGSHTFEVRATDAVGNVDQSVASRAWTVDATAPDTSITGGPTGTVNTGSASFTFTSSEAGSTFACRIDGGAFTACTSPQAYSGLANGQHTFEVRATDAANNPDTTPASRTWTVDTAAPDTSITGGPTGTVNTRAASFTFTSSEAGSTFACRIDGGTFTACTSPQAYNALADGPHTFEVRATDAAGNVDLTAASRAWTIDATAPDTSITGGPSGTVTTRTASFTFSSSEAGSTFACRIDGGTFTACTSPQAYSALADGPHTFEVRATDAAGNVDQTAASRAWTVDASAPDTTITGGPSTPVNSTTASFTFSSSEAGSTFACRIDGGAFTACTSPQVYSALPDGPHTFEVRATDAAGNADATPASRAWTVDTAAPDTAIGTGPTGTVNTASTSFTFSSPDAGATFQCRVDTGAFTACTSPANLGSLADGPHTFEVRAVDAAGNPDATPASRSWTIDTTPPQTTIDSGPAETETSADAAFAFSSTETGSTFQCRLDGVPFTACTSPVTYSGLPPGAHTFDVQATDPVGNVDPTPATQAWTIITQP